MPRPVHQGSVVKLMFQTDRGQVLGTAEMLIPVNHSQQPFRFLALSEADQTTLQSAFHSRLYRNIDEEEWIEEFRAALMNWNPYSVRRRVRAILATVTLAVLCLGSAIYFFGVHLK